MLETIAQALQWGRQELQAYSDSSALDAEVLLAHVLQKKRSDLYACPEQKLAVLEKNQFSSCIAKRRAQQPIAYLTGHQEFWSLDLLVTPDTLIPRPETELLVELVLNKLTGTHERVADLGTGSGAIALALAHERPDWVLHAVDISPAALDIARLNAKRLGINNVVWAEGSWCAGLPDCRFSAIVSNPPYIAVEDNHIRYNGLQYEPLTALVAGEDGLAALSLIIKNTKDYLTPGGYLLLEHGYQQAAVVSGLFAKNGYTEINLYQDLAGLDRVTIGRWF